MTEQTRTIPLIRRPRFVRWLKRVAVLATLVLAGFAGVLVWAFRTGRAAEFVRKESLTELRDRCGLNAEFSDLKLDPLGRDMVLTDLSIHDPSERRLLSVRSARVAIAFWPLLYGRVQLQRVTLVEPQAHIRMRQGVVVDLPPCIAPMQGSGAPINLGVTELAVEGGRFAIDVDDQLSAQLDDIGVVLAARSGGGMAVAVAVDDTDLVFRDRPLTMRRFRLSGRLEGLLADPRAMMVDELDVELGRVHVRGSGKVDLLGPVYSADLAIDMPLPVVNDYVPNAPSLGGDARINVGITGSLFFPRVVGSINVRRGRVDDFKLGDTTEVQFTLDEQGIDLRPAVIRLEDGEVAVRGRVNFDSKLSVRLDTRLRRASLARILDAVGSHDVLGDFKGTGRTLFRGTLRPLSLEGPFDFDVREFIVGDKPWSHPSRLNKTPSQLEPDQRVLWIPEGRMAGKWRFDDDGLTFPQLRVEAGTTVGTASAFVPFDKNGRMVVSARFEPFDFRDVGPISRLPFAGRGNVEMTIEGTFRRVQAVGRIKLQNTVVGDAPLGDLSARVRWHDQRRLDFTEVVSKIGASRYRGRVGVLLRGEVPLTISGRLKPGRLQDLFIPFRGIPAKWGDLKGEIDAKFDLQGPVTRLTGPVDAILGEGEIYGERWQRGRGNGRFDKGRMVVEGLELNKYRGRLLATGAFDPSRGDLSVVGRTRGLTLQSIDLIRANQPRLDGDMPTRFKVGGSVYGLTGTIAVDLRDVRAGSLELGRGRYLGRLRGSTLAFTGEGLEDAARLSGSMMLTEGLPYEAKIELKDVDGPAVIAGLAGHRAWRGNTSLVAELSGGLVDWVHSSGKLQVEEVRLETSRFSLGTTSPTDMTLKRGVLSVDRVLLGGPQSQLTVGGRLGAEVIDLRVGGRLDLALAELIGPVVEKSGGQLRLDAAIGGRPSALNLVGTGRIEGGLLKWQGLEDRITGFAADLTFSQSSVLIDRSEGRFAGGKIGLTGNVRIDNFFPQSVALTVGLRKVRPRLATRSVDVSGVLSGQLTVNGPFKRMRVRGALDVERGLAKPKIEWSGLVGTRPLAAVYDPAAELIDYDILLTSTDSFRLRNQDADLEMLGSFRFTGTNERMGMLGTLPVAQGGRVVFLGREYTFQSGTINFTERYRFAPRYDLRMTSESCDAQITIVLVGTLDTFELNYRSNPEMDQRDIVSCLIRGVKISDLDQDLASFAGSALLKLSGVDREVKKVLLIDQIEVTTEYSSLARAYEPRVLVAKNLSLLDRPARLEYSTSLLRTNDQRAAVRVRLTPQLNLQLGWTSSDDVPFGDWGLDLKRRWEW